MTLLASILRTGFSTREYWLQTSHNFCFISDYIPRGTARLKLFFSLIASAERMVSVAMVSVAALLACRFSILLHALRRCSHKLQVSRLCCLEESRPCMTSFMVVFVVIAGLYS